MQSRIWQHTGGYSPGYRGRSKRRRVINPASPAYIRQHAARLKALRELITGCQHSDTYLMNRPADDQAGNDQDALERHCKTCNALVEDLS